MIYTEILISKLKFIEKNKGLSSYKYKKAKKQFLKESYEKIDLIKEKCFLIKYNDLLELFTLINAKGLNPSDFSSEMEDDYVSFRYYIPGCIEVNVKLSRDIHEKRFEMIIHEIPFSYTASYEISDTIKFADYEEEKDSALFALVNKLLLMEYTDYLKNVIIDYGEK